MSGGKVPIALRQHLEAELKRLASLGVLEPVEGPTDWISSLVVVRKPNGTLRICLDPKPLNRALKRSHYPMPTIEDLIPQLSKAKVYTVCDLQNGFWHIALDHESSLLTTFGTPFGRFRWKRMPFGISPAPELFQRRLQSAIDDLPGVYTIADDVLIVGEGDTHEAACQDHDKKLASFLDRCRVRGIRLNRNKIKLRLPEVKYMGHILTPNGLKADPDKLKAILKMENPTDVAGVQRLIGTVNYLARFLPNLSSVCDELRQLTKKDVEFCWTSHHDHAIQQIKAAITTAPVLRYFDPQMDVTLQCDASEKGLGASLMQQGQPVAYASRALTDTETRYAQIEKELLAIVFGVTKLHHYAYDRHVTIESDHKPLEVIVQKPIHSAPKRLQRMLVQLQGYDTRSRTSRVKRCS